MLRCRNSGTQSRTSGTFRIIDLAGDDYLYWRKRFVLAELPLRSSVPYRKPPGAIADIRAAAKVLPEGGRTISVGSGLGTRIGFPGTTDYTATKGANLERLAETRPTSVPAARVPP